MDTKKMMILAGIAAAVLVLAVALVPMALAQAPVDDVTPNYGNGPMMDGGISRGSRMGMNNFTAGPMGQRGQGQGQGPGFVDKDGDGVCDHAGEAGHGPGFVDKDGDGVCDNTGTGGMRGGQGAGRMGRSQGQMMGRWAQQGTW